MKKLLLILISFATLSFAQAQDRAMNSVNPKFAGQAKANKKSATTKKQLVNSLLKTVPGSVTPQAVIYSQDFGSGLPGNFTITDNNGGGLWAYTTTGPNLATTFPALALSTTNTSAANGYMMFDSDGFGNDALPEDCDMKLPVINCTGKNTVFLSFNQLFLQYAASAGLVSVSTDNITFNDVYLIDNGNTQDSSTTNPDQVTIDISSIAANQATVYIRFKYTGDYDYFWLIDDITVFEPLAIDAGITSVTGPSNGCFLTANESLNITVKNFGSQTITNVPVSYKINNGTPVTETIPSIAANSTYAYTFTTKMNLSTPGTYTIKAYSVLSGDLNTANDADSTEVVNIASNNLSTPYTQGFEVNENIDGWTLQDGNADGVSWAYANTFAHTGTYCLRKAGSASKDNDWVFTACYDLTAGTNYSMKYWYRNFDLQAPCSLEVKLGPAPDSSSMNILIAQEAIDSIYHNSINSFTVPTTGTYYFGWHAFVPASSATAGSSSMRIDDINISAVTGLNEVAVQQGISMFPNPTSGTLNLRVKNYNNALVRIYNIMGAEVYNRMLSSQQSVIDLANFSNGLYIVKIEGTGFNYSEKINLNK